MLSARYGAAMTDRKQKQPTKSALPDPIPDTPENIMKAILNTPPKDPDEWRYLQDTDDD